MLYNDNMIKESCFYRVISYKVYYLFREHAYSSDTLYHYNALTTNTSSTAATSYSNIFIQMILITFNDRTK